MVLANVVIIVYLQLIFQSISQQEGASSCFPGQGIGNGRGFEYLNGPKANPKG